MFVLIGIRQEVNEDKSLKEILCLRNGRNFYEIRDLKIFTVKNFLGITHISKNKPMINLEIDDRNNITSIIPKLDLNKDFMKSNRFMEERPTWIFLGDSGLGKSFIGNLINEYGYLKIYETDSSSELPDTITEDIIVFGNKYKFNMDDIKSRIKDRKIILVNFNV